MPKKSPSLTKQTGMAGFSGALLNETSQMKQQAPSVYGQEGGCTFPDAEPDSCDQVWQEGEPGVKNGGKSCA